VEGEVKFTFEASYQSTTPVSTFAGPSVTLMQPYVFFAVNVPSPS